MGLASEARGLFGHCPQRTPSPPFLPRREEREFIVRHPGAVAGCAKKGVLVEEAAGGSNRESTLRCPPENCWLAPNARNEPNERNEQEIVEFFKVPGIWTANPSWRWTAFLPNAPPPAAVLLAFASCRLRLLLRGILVRVRVREDRFKAGTIQFNREWTRMNANKDNSFWTLAVGKSIHQAVNL
jgi:hypothetical protein